MKSPVLIGNPGEASSGTYSLNPNEEAISASSLRYRSGSEKPHQARRSEGEGARQKEEADTMSKLVKFKGWSRVVRRAPTLRGVISVPPFRGRWRIR